MRIKNSIVNTVYAISGQLISTIITFISRTIFIKILGADYLGISGLFYNILSMLSLAELGVGSAIIFSMYKPLLENDIPLISALMKFYSKTYKIIGIFIGCLGVAIVPFLNLFIKESIEIENIRIIYLLFLLNSVVSYFFAYKKSIIVADQKGYINTKNEYLFIVIQNILQIIILISTRSYILYLTIQIICSFLANLSISLKANKMYPYLKGKNKYKLQKKDKYKIYKNTFAMMCHKIGAIIVSGTDNILISRFVGIKFVGLYSNYLLIINTINLLINQVFNSITASVGNLNAELNNKKSVDIFNKLLFMSFWIMGFFSICLFELLPPFIKLWIGNEYLLSKSLLIIIIINFFISGMRQVSIIYINTMGLFWKIKYKSIFEGIINIIVSIFLLQFMGIEGVLLGTLISNIATNIWWEPYVVYKYGFNINVSEYFVKYFKYFIIFIFSTIFTTIICNSITSYSFLGIIKIGLVCLFIPNLLWVIIFYKNEEFNYFKNLILRLKNNI